MNLGGNIHFTHKNLFNWEINILLIDTLIIYIYTFHAGVLCRSIIRKMLPYKIVKNKSRLSVGRAFNIISILFYCGLYSMAIDIVTWRIIKKWCIWSLHLRNFLCLPVFALFLQKIWRMSHNSLNFIYIYIYIYI